MACMVSPRRAKEEADEPQPLVTPHTGLRYEEQSPGRIHPETTGTQLSSFGL